MPVEASRSSVPNTQAKVNTTACRSLLARQRSGVTRCEMGMHCEANSLSPPHITHNAQRIHYVHKTLRRAGLAPKGGIAVKGPSDELPSHSLWASDACVER